MSNNVVKYSVISVFVLLYAIVSTISMIHSIDFFSLSNTRPMSIALASAFEVGQVAALCGILILDKTSRGVVWSLFILLTSMQIMSNVYFSYKYMGDFSTWSELFGLIDEDKDVQKRALAIISGGVLPVVALGFIKSLVDYIRPSKQEDEPVSEAVKSESPEAVHTEVDDVKIDDLPEQTIVNIEEEQASEPERKIDESVDIESELSQQSNNTKEVITKKVDVSSNHYNLWKMNK